MTHINDSVELPPPDLITEDQRGSKLAQGKKEWYSKETLILALTSHTQQVRAEERQKTIDWAEVAFERGVVETEERIRKEVEVVINAVTVTENRVGNFTLGDGVLEFANELLAEFKKKALDAVLNKLT